MSHAAVPHPVGDTAAPAADLPTAYIAEDRRRALAAGQMLPRESTGAGVFADVSGFVGISEQLATEYGAQHGAEVLTSVLNRTIGAVVDEMERFGGATIYFSGDAVTSWFDGDDGHRAATAALAAVAAMTEAGRFVTDAGHEVGLGLKCSVATGTAQRYVVGDPRIQLIDVLAGDLLTELADTERVSTRGEVVLGPSAAAALTRTRTRSRRGRTGAELGDRRRLPDGSAAVVLERLASPAAPVPAEPDPDLPDKLVRPWLLPVVYERLRTGRGEFVAELRSALPVFIRFGGIHFEDEGSAARLDTFVRLTQDVFTTHGGNVLQLTLGDKGAYLYAVFGSPRAHGDDPVRAVAAARELEAAARGIGVTDIQIGITFDRVRSGTYGHGSRRTFVCLGAPVNLAARLMMAAPSGSIHVTRAVADATGWRFAWRSLGLHEIKGAVEPVEVLALSTASTGGATSSIEASIERGRFVGRRDELARVRAVADALTAGSGGLITIRAEAGRGKSRLIGEGLRGLDPARVRMAVGEPSMTNVHGSFQVWQPILRTVLGLHPEDDAAACHDAVTRLLPDQAERVPLLGVAIGCDLPESEVTAAMDAKVRKSSREDLVVRLLEAAAHGMPILLVIEEAHRLDSLSRDLLAAVARLTTAEPLAIVLAMRPAEPDTDPLALLANLPGQVLVDLDVLDDEEERELVTDRLRAVLGADVPADSLLVRQLRDRAQGNPFYVEQLANYVGGLGIDPSDAAAVARIELPTTLHSVVLERLDTLPERPRQTVKVASVVGRSFHQVLVRAAYPPLGSPRQVFGHLRAAARPGLVEHNDDDRRPWRFLHNLLQEVAYESLPFAMRARLHGQIATRLESVDPNPTGSELDLLTHHWWLSGRVDKQLEYLGRAAAAAQERYANDAAIDYWDRLAGITTGVARARALRGIGQVLELTGAWDTARSRYEEALGLSDGDPALRGWCETSLADVARRQGSFEEAVAGLQRAAEIFTAIGDDGGRAQVSRLRGTLAAQQGQYAEAREHYLASLALRPEGSDDRARAATMSNLGVVAEYEGDLAGARGYHEAALAVRERLGDLWAIGVSRTGLGMISLLEHEPQQAREEFTEAMRLNETVGDAWMVAITHNNLGNADRDLGDSATALAHYASAAARYHESSDLWSLAFLLEDAAVCHSVQGDPERAVMLLGLADRCRGDLGSPRPDSLEAELAERLTEAHDALGQEAWEDARQRGRALETSAVVALIGAGDVAPA